MSLKNWIKLNILIKSNRYRNKQTMRISGVSSNKVNLEYWEHAKNLGDCLSPIIVNWLLEKKGLSLETEIKGIKHLYAIGSVIGMGGTFDATIWGSGLHTKEAVERVYKQRKLRDYDIRAVRGPRTAEVMKKAGYNCPDIYGDPAVILPELYAPEIVEKKYKYSLIHHYTKKIENTVENDVQIIDILTSDYEKLINKIVSSECVISSSLHGIILAESYGVPAIFLNEGMDGEIFKFYDWYYSTGRKKVIMAKSVSEAMKITPMELPDLSRMKTDLIRAFPYDLWTENLK